METVDYSVYEEQIRKLVDKQVIGTEVREPDGVYLVHQLGQEKPEDWSEEKTRNETDMIRTRLRKTIEQELAADPYAQKVFGELLRQAIAEAEAMFEHTWASDSTSDSLTRRFPVRSWDIRAAFSCRKARIWASSKASSARAALMTSAMRRCSGALGICSCSLKKSVTLTFRRPWLRAPSCAMPSISWFRSPASK